MKRSDYVKVKYYLGFVTNNMPGKYQLIRSVFKIGSASIKEYMQTGEVTISLAPNEIGKVFEYKEKSSVTWTKQEGSVNYERYKYSVAPELFQDGLFIEKIGSDFVVSNCTTRSNQINAEIVVEGKCRYDELTKTADFIQRYNSATKNFDLQFQLKQEGEEFLIQSHYRRLDEDVTLSGSSSSSSSSSEEDTGLI